MDKVVEHAPRRPRWSCDILQKINSI